MKGVPCMLTSHLLLTSPFCHVWGARSAQMSNSCSLLFWQLWWWVEADKRSKPLKTAVFESCKGRGDRLGGVSKSGDGLREWWDQQQTTCCWWCQDGAGNFSKLLVRIKLKYKPLWGCKDRLRLVLTGLLRSCKFWMYDGPLTGLRSLVFVG